MPKMKTHSGAKKRFKVTAKRKIKAQQAKTRHMMMNKPKSMKRKARGTSTLFEGDANLIFWAFLPYGRKRNRNKNKPKYVSKAKRAATTAKGGQ